MLGKTSWWVFISVNMSKEIGKGKGKGIWEGKLHI